MNTLNSTRNNKNKSINIEDSDGNLVRTVYFNPTDLKGIESLAEAAEKASKISPNDIKSIINAVEDIFREIDKTFGEGVAKLLTGDVINQDSMETIKEFICIALPFYQKTESVD